MPMKSAKWQLACGIFWPGHPVCVRHDLNVAPMCCAAGFGTASLTAKEPEAMPFCALAYSMVGVRMHCLLFSWDSAPLDAMHVLFTGQGHGLALCVCHACTLPLLLGSAAAMHL